MSSPTCGAALHSPWTDAGSHASGGLGAALITTLLASLMDAQHRLGDTAGYPADVTSLRPEYDFIVVGGGTAGAVVASRLSEIAGWNVLLLEAGGDPPLTSEIPPLFHSLQETDIDWQYRTEPQERGCLGMVERRCNWPRGKVLGGSSVLNALLHVRGNRRDYDEWEAAGNPGWGYRDVLPYFKKSEDLKSPGLARDGEYSDEYHSTGGYLSLDRFEYRSPIVDGFVQAARAMGHRVGDVNGATQTGFTLQHGTLVNGTRCNTAKAFLGPARRRENLHVAKHAHATRILVDPATNTAHGVEFKRHGRVHTVNASKEVILSAGSVNSPQLLMLSGIGPKEHLQALGIPVIRNLKVGENLQDHMQLVGPTFMFNRTNPQGLDEVKILEDTFQYLMHRTGPLASIDLLQFQGFISSKYVDQADIDYPDIQFQHIRFPHKDVDTTRRVSRVTGFTDAVYDAVFGVPNAKAEIYIPLSVLQRPKSRGVIRLKSRDPLAHPLIDPRYLSERQDVLTLVEGIKFAAAMAGTEPLATQFEVRMSEERVPGCEGDMASDEYWECAVRTLATTIYHPVGTCKMGPVGNPDAVVDARLRVHGVRGLRVIDASIMPTIVTGNTNSPTIMIGEKGADLVKEDWLEE